MARKEIEEMSDGEKLTEIVETMRALQDALVTMQDAASKNPLLRGIVGSLGK